MQNSIHTFNATLEKSHLWLKELKELARYQNEEEAYCALRSVLHALRDRLIADEAVHLGAELPMLIRGAYYEGWKPAATPHREKTQAEFIDHVRENLHGASDKVEPEHAINTVFRFLTKKISNGELHDVQSELPAELRALWHPKESAV